MKTIVLFLCLLFTSNTLATTNKELIRQAVEMYLALEKSQDKVTLLLSKDLAQFTEKGKTYKTLLLHLKMDIASQVYFRRLRLKLQIENKTKFNPLPYAVGLGAGLILGILLTK